MVLDIKKTICNYIWKLTENLLNLKFILNYGRRILLLFKIEKVAKRTFLSLLRLEKPDNP